MAENKSSISHANSDDKMGEFWDTHDFTEFDNLDAPDVPLEISHAVHVESELFFALEEQAARRGVELETLVNLWLQEKLNETLKPASA